MNNGFGFYRFAAVCPKLKVADTEYNVAEIKKATKEAVKNGAKVVVFPELSITGYTCNDLFHQETLLQKTIDGITDICQMTQLTSDVFKNVIIAVGAPLRIFGRLYNCAVLIQNGSIVAVTPKIHLPNQREFYEKRHFSSGYELLKGDEYGHALTCRVGAYEPVITNLLGFANNTDIRIGVELCEDLWTPAPPSGELALAGANVILNLSASDALVGKANYRRDLVTNQSARCMAGYVYASAGVHESTTDMVCSGHLMIAENGSLMAECNKFSRDTEIIYADVDVARLNMQRISEGSFQDFGHSDVVNRFRVYHPINFRDIDPIPTHKELKYRYVSPTPFVPSSDGVRNECCREIFTIQWAGLAKRLETGVKRSVIGLSGGLDSTLALLVVYETYKLLGRPVSDILAVTMPGFGTTKRTKNNAVEMANALGVELRTINISKACVQHFDDIGHDPKVTDVTYENTQARERTQILMDLANKEQGMVIGTGDLSEIALGWCTYNADHMSMYSVNCDIPKTLVRYIVGWYADKADNEYKYSIVNRMVGEGDDSMKKLSEVLKDILNTPVSPELLPADSNGNIAQKTESILGSYEIHDFYLYHFVKYGATPDKMLYLAQYAFNGKYKTSDLKKALQLFLRRFFSQQFKRSCIPDGPKVGTLSLSPRADWRMPSDASVNDWLNTVK